MQAPPISRNPEVAWSRIADNFQLGMQGKDAFGRPLVLDDLFRGTLPPSSTLLLSSRPPPLLSPAVLSPRALTPWAQEHPTGTRTRRRWRARTRRSVPVPSATLWNRPCRASEGPAITTVTNCIARPPVRA